MMQGRNAALLTLTYLGAERTVANYNLKKFADAEASARAAQKLDTAHRFPKVEHILACRVFSEGLRRLLLNLFC